MEKLIADNSTTALLAGLVIVLSLHLITKLGHFVWEINREKHQLTDESIKQLTGVIAANTEAVHSLEERMRRAENQLSEFNKFKIDLRLLFAAIKNLAGDKWPVIRKMSEDEFSG